MNLKYSIQSEDNQIDFHVDTDSGSLIIEIDAIAIIEVPHLVAIELIELLRAKLYSHSDNTETIFKKLFK